jgi:hypothetical protein
MNYIIDNFNPTMDFIFFSGDILDANIWKEIALSIMNQTNSSGQSCNSATHIATITVNVTGTIGTNNTRT